MNGIFRLASLAAVAAFMGAMPATGEYLVVANAEHGSAQITKADLRRLYTGKKNTMGQTQAVPINLPLDSALAGEFLEAVVGMTPEEYKEYWIQEQVKGGGTAPMIQRTSASVISVVKVIPGAVGYVDKGAVVDSVKILTVR